MKLRSLLFGFGLFLFTPVLVLAGGWLLLIRAGTTVIGDFVSPDGRQDAVLMVRNGGAPTGYSTSISLVSTTNPLARQFALIRGGGGNLFVADDNGGQVQWGDRGQLDVKVSWISNTEIHVLYPAKAQVFRQETHHGAISVGYVSFE